MTTAPIGASSGGQRRRDETLGATADPRWKDLYRIGGIACIVSVIIIVLGFIAYFIWPYAPGRVTTADVFASIQTDWLGGLIALDFRSCWEIW